jgi:phospholipid/cholesterol/gamma-HCH transport system ATP-binding protein
MGSSGGGKTTLLRCIAALLRPSAGTIEVNGVDTVAEPERAREHLGLVFQSAALFDYMTVQENILFGVRRRKRLSAAQQTQLVRDMLAKVGLGEVNDLMPAELSGGMQKRVGLARALVLEPKLLLYDEPTSGLDPVTAYAIDSLILQMRDQLGITSVVVSHDVTSVYRVADRVAFLHEGRMVFLGTVAEFKSTRDPAILELVEKAFAERIGS